MFDATNPAIAQAMSDSRTVELFRLVKSNRKDEKISAEEFQERFALILAEFMPVQPEPKRRGRPANPNKPAKVEKTYPEEFIPRDQLPAVVGSHNKASMLTRSYSHIHTLSIVDAFEQIGWGPYRGKGAYNLGVERNARGLESGRTDDTARHMLTFRPFNTDGLAVVGKRIVQAYLVNAHDGTSMLRFNLGTCEYVCSNGAMVQRSGFALALRHMGLTLEHIIKSFTAMLENASVMLEQTRILESLPVSQAQALEFAARAIPLRWEENKPQPAMLLTSAYAQQSEQTMYNVYQNVQRNLMYPDFNIPSSTKSGTRKVTSVRGLDKIVNINTGLDLLMGEFVEENFPSVELPQPTYIGSYENPIEA